MVRIITPLPSSCIDSRPLPCLGNMRRGVAIHLIVPTSRRSPLSLRDATRRSPPLTGSGVFRPTRAEGSSADGLVGRLLQHLEVHLIDGHCLPVRVLSVGSV